MRPRMTGLVVATRCARARATSLRCAPCDRLSSCEQSQSATALRQICRHFSHPLNELRHDELDDLVGSGAKARGGCRDEGVEGFGAGEDDARDGAEVCGYKASARRSHDDREAGPTL